MPRPLQINPAVIFRRAAAGGDTIDDPIKGMRQSGQRFRPGHVTDQRTDPGGFQFVFRRGLASQAGNLVPQADEFRAQRQTDVTTTNDQAFH